MHFLRVISQRILRGVPLFHKRRNRGSVKLDLLLEGAHLFVSVRPGTRSCLCPTLSLGCNCLNPVTTVLHDLPKLFTARMWGQRETRTVNVLTVGA